MPEIRSPYDTGDRLEPHLWDSGEDTPADDFGKVDFTNDSGETIFTAHVQKTEAGYILRVDEHQDVELTIETSSDRQIREAAMQRLDAGLRVIAAEHVGAVFFVDDGEPESFGAGNYIFTPLADGVRRRFVVNEEFVGTDWSDDDRVPNSWTWEAAQYSTERGCWEATAEGECGPDTIEQLLDQARAWAAEIPPPARPAPWPHATIAPEQTTRPSGPTY